MPLPLPSLDDRTWTDLTAEGLALIPRYAPTWTNQNVSDPGITLVELFAWLTEMTIYRLDRISPRHRHKFLELLGFEMQLPQAAAAFLNFVPAMGTDSFELPAGVQFQAVSSAGLSVPFRTLNTLDISPVNLRAIQVDQGDGNIQDFTTPWSDQTLVAAFGLNPQPGAALYLGFDELPSQIPLALGFRFEGPGNDAQERRRIEKEWAAQQAACIPFTPRNGCGYGESASVPSTGVLPPYHSAQLVYEVFTLAPSNWWKLQPVSAPARPYPGEVVDDTRSLTLDGIVEMNLPPALIPAVLGQVSAPLYYLRCRLLSGTWDAPPMLVDVAPNSVLAEQSVPVWQSYPIAAGVAPGAPAPTPGLLVGFDAQLDGAETMQALNIYAAGSPDRPDVMVIDYQAPTSVSNGQITLAMILAGFGSGLPHQLLTLPSLQVRSGSFHVYTLVGSIWQEWTLRHDFDASQRTDFHAVLDYAGGTLSFGNGQRGQVVAAGALVFCGYLATQADSGDTAAATVTQLAASPWNSLLLATLDTTAQQSLNHITSNRGAASGGAAIESLAHATGRAVETLFAHERLLDLCAAQKVSTLDRIPQASVLALQAPHRGVNLIDLERLAFDVPGTRVARARAWASLHPGYPCLEATGVVTITVMPATPTAKPLPSDGLLKAIGQFLNLRRIVCTRLEIVGPAYVTVSVQASVQTVAGSNVQRVQAAIVAALNLFLDPRLGGPEALGWPFGRDVIRSEIMQIVCAVAGVDYVISLTLTGDSGTAQCGNLTLCGMSLATPGNHQIAVS
jgi:hypothetical protein